MLLNHDGSRLFVTSGSTDKIRRHRYALETSSCRAERRVRLRDQAREARRTRLTLSPDGSRLFVAEADNNAIAVFDLSATTSAVPTASGTDKLSGRIPTGWYPTAVVGDKGFTLRRKRQRKRNGSESKRAAADFKMQGRPAEHNSWSALGHSDDDGPRRRNWRDARFTHGESHKSEWMGQDHHRFNIRRSST